MRSLAVGTLVPVPGSSSDGLLQDIFISTLLPTRNPSTKNA